MRIYYLSTHVCALGGTASCAQRKRKPVKRLRYKRGSYEIKKQKAVQVKTHLWFWCSGMGDGMFHSLTMRGLWVRLLLVSATCCLRWGTDSYNFGHPVSQFLTSPFIALVLERMTDLSHADGAGVLFWIVLYFPCGLMQHLPGRNSQRGWNKWQHHHLHTHSGRSAGWLWQQAASWTGRWD